MTIGEMVREAYRTAREHGFHDGMPGSDAGITADDYHWRAKVIPEKLALIHSEVSEALEAYRENPETVCRVMYAENGKPVGFWSEMADILIRVGDLCGLLDIDLECAVVQKMIYNKKRPYKHGKAF